MIAQCDAPTAPTAPTALHLVVVVIQLFAQLGMVVDLAVDSQHDVAARAHQRLVAALWVHDAEPLVGKH